MLSTDDRALLVDLLAPPADGFRLERAVGTTFTLNLESLLRVPLAIAGAELQEGMDPLGVLHAVQSSADRVDLFCQTGMVTVPPYGTGLLAFLEPTVHQVSRPRPGRLFHPKVWLLSFANEHGERHMRFLCGSRNLTADRTWDAVVALEGVVTGRPRSVNRPLADFVASLPARSVTGIPSERATAIAELAEHVRGVEWEPPAGARADDWLTFHVFGPGRASSPDLSGRRRLVISPFLTADGLEHVWPDGECTVISRAESLASLDADYRQRLVDEREAELKLLDDTAAIPDLDAEEAGRRWELTGLHAKVYVVERGHHAHVFIGSANATSNAWDGNDEVLVELVGGRKAFGIDRVLGPGDASLANVLVPFVEGRHDPPADDELRRQLEQTLISVAEVPFHAQAVEHADSTWSEVVSTSAPLPVLPDGAMLSMRLISSADERSPATAEPVSEEWHGLDAEDLTPFVALTLRSGTGSGEVSVTTTVLAELTGAPEDRLDRLVARHVGSPDAFLRFLLMLLHADDEAARFAAMHGTGGESFGPFGGASAGVLESLVLALAERPQTLDDIERLVDRLHATEQGRQVLPPGWEDLWAQVRAARHALEGRHR